MRRLPLALPAAPAPLVLVFHGGGGNGPGTECLSRFTPLADREGFLGAFSEGIGKNWNDGRELASSRAHRDHVDDVGFVSALIDAIGRAHAVDARRVYATGISNGAVFSHYLAAHLSARIAAIAPVVGGIADPPGAWLRPEQPVDTEEAALDGTRDPVREPHPADSGVERCGGLRTVYPGGRGDREVVLVRLDGGGHSWPGGAQYLPRMLAGRVCHDLDATAVIWDFFRAHPRRGGP
jgi:polyhydroxybutyrate depolymerase